MIKYFALFILMMLHRCVYSAVEFQCFYPENGEYFTFVNESGVPRMFQRTMLDPSSLVGEGGWYGKIHGRRAVVMPPDGKTKYWEFDEGLPVDAGRPRHVAESKIKLSDLFISQEEVQDAVHEASLRDIWNHSDRHRMFFKNPNVEAAFLAPFFLMFFLTAIRIKGLICKILFFLLSGGVAYFIFKTGSRGGFLAIVCPLLFMLVVSFRRWFSWKRFAVMLLAATGIICSLVLTRCADKFTRDLFVNDVSNSLRLEVLKAVPQMVQDSPNGVGIGNSGATYLTWYRVEDKTRILRTLISSHLTWFVEFGHLGRCLYVFAWLFALFFLFYATLSGASPIPFCAWLSLFIAGLFNPVLEAWQVWLPATVSLLFFLPRRLKVSLKVTALLGAFALIISGIILYAILCIPSNEENLKLNVNGPIVKIQGEDPKVWIVGDSQVVGGWTFVGQEFADYYWQTECTNSVGYVESLDALPLAVDKLVLTGRFAGEYLERWRQGGDKSRLCRAGALLLVSPSVPVSEFDKSMSSSGHIRAVVGSLVLENCTEYAGVRVPSWTRKVKGSLLYIPGWIALAIDF